MEPNRLKPSLSGALRRQKPPDEKTATDPRRHHMVESVRHPNRWAVTVGERRADLQLEIRSLVDDDVLDRFHPIGLSLPPADSTVPPCPASLPGSGSDTASRGSLACDYKRVTYHWNCSVHLLWSPHVNHDTPLVPRTTEVFPPSGVHRNPMIIIDLIEVRRK